MPFATHQYRMFYEVCRTLNTLTSFLFTIIAACVIAAVAKQLLHGSSHYKALGNFICGVFVLLSALSPFIDHSWMGELPDEYDFSQQIDTISYDAQMYRKEAMQQSIISQTQAYVWNKAQALSLDIDFDITLCNDYPYAPCEIQIIGHVSPYAKTKLSNFLEKDIGIPKEAQTWISG